MTHSQRKEIGVNNLCCYGDCIRHQSIQGHDGHAIT